MTSKSRFLTVLPLLFCWLFSFAQKADLSSISVNYQAHNTQLAQVLNELNDKYGLEFSFATERFQNKVVTATCTNLQLEEALNVIFVENDIDYQIVDDKILLRIKEEVISDDEESDYFKLSGTILDHTTGDPLEYVAVNIHQTSIADISDHMGHFSLSIPKSYITDTIQFQLLGYKNQKLIIDAGSKTAMVYRLVPSPIIIDEITLIYRKSPLEIEIVDQSTYLDNSSFSGLNDSQVGADIMKTIQMMPGVTAHDDVSSDIKIRGSNSDETLIIMDGIPLYNSSHYYGIFSGINSSYIDEIRLYKNAFPITYGGKTGGVVELNSSDDIGEGVHGEIDLNLLASSAIIDIPLSSKSKLKLSGRSTLSNLSNSTFFKFSNQKDVEENVHGNFENLSRRILLNTDPKFNFQDVNAKWVLNPDHNNQISFNFYFSNDDFDNSYSNSFEGRNGNIKATYTETFTNIESWQNLGFSGAHIWRKNGYTIKSKAYFTKYKNDATIGLELMKVSDQVPDKHLNFINSQENFVEDKSIDISISKKLGKSSELTFGTNFLHHNSMFEFNEEFSSILEGNDQATEFSQYLSFSKTFAQQLVFDLGLRGSHYSLMDNYFLSPRLKISYLATKNVSFKASYSKYHQFLRELSHENRLGQNIQFWVLSQDELLPVSSSQNYMLGATLKLNLFDLDIEYFNKDMDGIAEHALIRPGFDGETAPPSEREYQLFVGTGKSYGIDLMISKHTKLYQGWVAYTLSSTTHSFEEIANGVDFPSQNDRKHQLKFINEFTVGKFNIGANYIYSSGRPYTDLARIAAISDRTDLLPEERLKYLPNYQRVDFSVKYNFDIGKTKAQAGISLFNAFNNENVNYLQYIYSIPTNNPDNQGFINNILGAQTPLLSRTMNLSFKLGF